MKHILLLSTVNDAVCFNMSFPSVKEVAREKEWERERETERERRDNNDLTIF